MCWAHAQMVIQANPSQVRILLLIDLIVYALVRTQFGEQSVPT